MSRPLRSHVFDPDVVGVYHCFNRCVRRGFLCGIDPLTKIDYSHRRDWFYEKLKELSQYFAIDLLGFAVLSNHYHLILRNRPDQVKAMTDRQVVRDWLMICPPRRSKKTASGPPTDAEIDRERQRPGRVETLRQRLSSPSWLIRQLAQYMSIRCNAEDGVRGHFWESRFGMQRLLDEAAVLGCLAYVDLNPLRAGLCDSLEGYPHVSISERLRTGDATGWLAPLELAGQSDGQHVTVVNRLSREELAKHLADQLDGPLGCLPIGLSDYAKLLGWLADRRGSSASNSSGSGACSASPPDLLSRLQLNPKEFADLSVHFVDRFSTAIGCTASLKAEAHRRGCRRIGGPGQHSLRLCPDRGSGPPGSGSGPPGSGSGPPGSGTAGSSKPG